MFQIGIGPRERKSPFFDRTVAAGATAFTIYNHMYMPVSYGDTHAEYRRLTEGVSVWDVSAERQVRIAGPDASAMIDYLTPRDMSATRIGQGRYVAICDHDGNVINDPVLLKLAEDRYWLSIADADILLWARAVAGERGFDARIDEPDVSPLAVQGPLAINLMRDLFGDWVNELRYFWFRETDLDGIPMVVCRSGWSKQGGFELFLRDGSRGPELWDRVFEAGRRYGVGPGAPNYIERVESGLLSVGADNEPDCDPFELGLGKLVDLDKPGDFIGKAALAGKAGLPPRRRLVGVFIDGKPLTPNQHPWPAFAGGRRIGAIRAVAHSPRLEKNIGIALLASEHAETDREVSIDGEYGELKGVVTTLPFIE